MTSTYAGARAGGPWGLTPLQERTMDLVIRGLTNKEVAGLLGTSPHTVRNTLVNVFKKVGVTRRSELAFVVKNGITDGDPCRVRHAVSQHRTLIAAIAGQSPSPTRRAERRTTER